jgi:hypothetical protein
MATTTSPSLAQHASPAVTREQIEATIRSLQPFERVMIRLLMLQYLDPTHDDVTFMAQERSEPNMKAGHKFGGFAVGTDRKIILPREWITAIEHKVQQYASQVRDHRKRLDLQISFMTDYLQGLERETQAIETLLITACGFDGASLEELRLQARQALITYALRKLSARAEKQEVEEDAYLKERLSLEYQAQHRRRDRFKKRLEQMLQERRVVMLSSLSDEHLATIWGIAQGPILSRRVKAIQRYVNALALTLNAPLQEGQFAAAVNAGLGSRMAGGNKNEGVGTKTLEIKEDLWSKTLQSLPPAPAPLEPKPCEHDGGGKVLAGLLRSLATYLMSEEDESKLWTRTNQCLPCLLRLRNIQEEAYVVDETAESVIERVRARTMMPRKDEPQAPPVEDPEVAAAKLADLEERLRPFIGTNVLPVGAKTW